MSKDTSTETGTYGQEVNCDPMKSSNAVDERRSINFSCYLFQAELQRRLINLWCYRSQITSNLLVIFLTMTDEDISPPRNNDCVAS